MCATVVALVFSVYLIGKLKSFPEEYRNAGSPSAFWNDFRAWSFLIYVLKGRFLTISDANLVTKFKAYRALEITRMTLFVIVLVDWALVSTVR